MKRLTKSTWYEIAFIYYDDSSTATYDTAETLGEAMDKVDNIIEGGEDLTEVESIFIDKWYYDGHENYRDSKFETVLYEKDEDEV